MSDQKYNYHEDVILKQLKEYIDSTYTQHYAQRSIQTVDVWDAMGIAQESCLSNIIKYATRFGKKDGHNKKDLLKIIHYTILLWHYSQQFEDPVEDRAPQYLVEVVDGVLL